MTHTLETLSHPQGAVVTGWVAPRVLYARFLETLPAALAIRFAFHLGRVLQDKDCVRYFGDSSELEGYEPRSGDVLRNFFQVQRHRFASIHIAVSTRRMELVAGNFASVIGGERVRVVSPSEFRTSLASAAPRYEDALNPRKWRSIPPVSIAPPSR